MIFSVLIRAVEGRTFVWATRFVLANPLLMAITVVSCLDWLGRWFGGAL